MKRQISPTEAVGLTVESTNLIGNYIIFYFQEETFVFGRIRKEGELFDGGIVFDTVFDIRNFTVKEIVDAGLATLEELQKLGK